MASSLKWRMGFGPEPIVVALCAALAAVASGGIMRWLAAAVFLLACGYAAYHYRRWNAPGWRKVHFRAMLAYAQIAERQQAVAGESGREPDATRACVELGLLLCGEDRTAVVDAMLAELRRYEGAYLVGLFERHAAQVLPGATVDLRHDSAARLRAMRLWPELVIASVIENI